MIRGGTVIIGAGEAGMCAAFALCEAGWAGRITLVGDELQPPMSARRSPRRQPAPDQLMMRVGSAA